MTVLFIFLLSFTNAPTILGILFLFKEEIGPQYTTYPYTHNHNT